MPRPIKLISTLSLLLLLAGCETLRFYQQAARGQAGLLWQQTTVDELLQSDLDPALRDRIEFAGEILAFAAQLGLPANGAYQSYVETGQPFVIWNVFAARPYELSLKKSCFPVAGCVTYRGYFRRDDADRYARRLENKGYEVYVGGVTAYSTLGWFDDPLLDTFLFRSDDELAALLFHELAHQLVYVKGDTRFNESMATTVELYALEQWLLERGEPGQFERYRRSLHRRHAVVELIAGTRGRLTELYASGVPVIEMETNKQSIFLDMREDYARLQQNWQEGEEFSRWMQGPMTNAKLETVADYNEWVPVLTSMLNEMGFEAFVQELSRLKSLPQAERDAALGLPKSAGNTLY